MSNKIDQEIDAMAENMEKSTQDPADQLFKTIEEMGPEVIKSKMVDMNDDEKELLKAALEEMSLRKSGTASFDKEADGAKYFQGRVLDGKIQEDQVSDDADEKLVTKEGAKQFHQGSPNGEWKGQAIQDPTDSDNDDNQLVDTGKIAKSITMEFENITDFLTEDMIGTLAKSFGEDFDMIEDYFNSDDEFADQLLEKGAKTTTQNGIRVYAEGKNAGRPVGSIRGDKASVKSIARARKKGKISAKGAKEGIKDVNSKDRYEKRREKVGMGAVSGKDDKTIQADARKKMAEKRHRYDSGTESKGTHKKLTDEMRNVTAASRAARDKKMKETENKKDGTPKKSSKNAKLQADLDSKRAEAKPKVMENQKKMMTHIKDSNDRSKKMQARLKEKRDKMKKAMEFEMETNLLKAMASDEVMTQMLDKMINEREMTQEVVKSMMLEKGMDEARCDRLMDSVVKSTDTVYEKQIVDGKEVNVQLEKGKMKEKAIEGANKLKAARESGETVMDEKATKVLEEEDQISSTKQMTEGKTRNNSDKGPNDKLGEDNKKNMTKSIQWGERNDILKSDRGGRNHSFNVSAYYDAVLAKVEAGEGEELVKSENEKEDINDIIQKSHDQSWYDVQKEAQMKAAQAKQNGQLVTSFSDNEIAAALGLSEEEAKKILG